MRRRINRLLRRFGYELRRVPKGLEHQTTCISLPAEGTVRGRVLLAFIIDPFLVAHEGEISSAHQHDVVSFLMAKVFRQLGYHVDVIDYRNTEFRPRHRYDFFVSARTNLERIKRRINRDCVVIAHLDTAHFLFNNHAAYARSLDLQRRRGVTIIGGRLVEHNRAIEHADFATVMGNHFTADTYRYAGKPLFPLWGTTVHTYPWDGAKDFDRCRNRFLWLGSEGMVHKGLDRVLEAFVGLPECRLTVCGPVERERRFQEAFRHELYHTPNIQTVGWVDVGSDDFRRIVAENVALVYPSCAEGKSGAALTCMQAGLIPVLSRESGVDVQEFGIILEDSTIDAIRDAVRRLASAPAEELEMRARSAWEHARLYHTRERFERQYREIVEEIILRSSGK